MALSMHPVDVGIRSEAAVMLELTRLGFDVYTPFNFNSRADLLLDVGTRVLRVQVKTGRISRGGVAFSTQSVTSNTKGSRSRGYVGEIDFFAVHCPALQETWMVPIEDACRSSALLRLEPTANNQERHVRWAKDYRLTDFRPE